MERDTKAIQRLGEKDYDNIMDYIADVTARGSEFVNNIREDWIINCLKQAGLNPDVLVQAIKLVAENSNNPDQSAQKLVNNFYQDNNIYIAVHNNKEFLMMGDTPIGVWDNNIGIAVEGDKLKMTIQKWGDSK